MLIDRNFKIPFSFLDPLSTHLFRIHGSWKTSFSCQVFFPRLGRLSFKVCILLCLLMPSQQTNSLIASTDLSVTYNKGRGKQAFWSPNTITEKAFSICFDSILNLLFFLKSSVFNSQMAPTLRCWAQCFIVQNSIFPFHQNGVICTFSNGTFKLFFFPGLSWILQSIWQLLNTWGLMHNHTYTCS